MVWLLGIGLALLFVAVAAFSQRSPSREAEVRPPAPPPFAPVPVPQPIAVGPAARAATEPPPLPDRRVLAFESLGLEPEAAALAAWSGVDLAEFRALCERGCRPGLALEILA